MDLRTHPLVNGTAYLLALAGTIIAEEKGLHGLELVCKPTLMLVLSSWFFFTTRRFGDRFTLLVQAGLFFSLLGDIALLFQGRDEFAFLLGLAAFLVAQVCYTMAFVFNIVDVGGGEGWVLSLAISAVIVLVGTFILIDVLQRPVLDELLVLPVAVYGVAILLMAITAAFRFRRTFLRSFLLVLVGALLFVLSDSLLAMRKFSLRPDSIPPIWIMLSYGTAQALIAIGCVLHVLDPETRLRRQVLET
ncbi:MAG: lysoplasmalogenase [Flavobacteriales bacterium]|nr:lysoplasmalogenase [Flavobacteriales bacterium]